MHGYLHRADTFGMHYYDGDRLESAGCSGRGEIRTGKRDTENADLQFDNIRQLRVSCPSWRRGTALRHGATAIQRRLSRDGHLAFHAADLLQPPQRLSHLRVRPRKGRSALPTDRERPMAGLFAKRCRIRLSSAVLQATALSTRWRDGRRYVSLGSKRRVTATAKLIRVSISISVGIASV